MAGTKSHLCNIRNRLKVKEEHRGDGIHTKRSVHPLDVRLIALEPPLRPPRVGIRPENVRVTVDDPRVHCSI